MYGKSRPLSKEERLQKREEKRAKKKERTKALFNAQYDETDVAGGTYFDEWKSQMDQQAKVCHIHTHQKLQSV